MTNNWIKPRTVLKSPSGKALVIDFESTEQSEANSKKDFKSPNYVALDKQIIEPLIKKNKLDYYLRSGKPILILREVEEELAWNWRKAGETKKKNGKLKKSTKKKYMEWREEKIANGELVILDGSGNDYSKHDFPETPLRQPSENYADHAYVEIFNSYWNNIENNSILVSNDTNDKFNPDLLISDTQGTEHLKIRQSAPNFFLNLALSGAITPSEFFVLAELTGTGEATESLAGAWKNFSGNGFDFFVKLEDIEGNEMGFVGLNKKGNSVFSFKKMEANPFASEKSLYEFGPDEQLGFKSFKVPHYKGLDKYFFDQGWEFTHIRENQKQSKGLFHSERVDGWFEIWDRNELIHDKDQDRNGKSADPTRIIPKRSNIEDELDKALRSNEKYKKYIKIGRLLLNKGYLIPDIIRFFQSVETANELIEANRIDEAKEFLATSTGGVVGGVLGGITGAAIAASLFPEPTSTILGVTAILGFSALGKVLGTELGEDIGQEVLRMLEDEASQGEPITLERLEEIFEETGKNIPGSAPSSRLLNGGGKDGARQTGSFNNSDQLSHQNLAHSKQSPAETISLPVGIDSETNVVERELALDQVPVPKLITTSNLEPTHSVRTTLDAIQAKLSDYHRRIALLNSRAITTIPLPKPARKIPNANLGLAFNHLNNRHG